MQSYTDLKLYPQGEFWQDKSEKPKTTQDKTLEAMLSLRNTSEDILFKSDTASKILKLLVGREDIFAKEELDSGSSRVVSPDLRPLTEMVLRDHLLGKITADTYVQRPNSTVKFIVFDVDISKQILLRVDRDISAFGDLDNAVSEVLMKCNLMRYLCLKSVKTNYLNHFERLTILYVFGHLGDSGKEFVHTVMSFTLNYKHHVTESFIRKMP